jgi:hypothetical protein
MVNHRVDGKVRKRWTCGCCRFAVGFEINLSKCTSGERPNNKKASIKVCSRYIYRGEASGGDDTLNLLDCGVGHAETRVLYPAKGIDQRSGRDQSPSEERMVKI